MNWQTGTAFALYLALLAPAALVLLKGRGSGEAISLSRLGPLAAGYTILFIGLAFYWQVPIGVKQSVYAESRKIISATPDRLSCDQVLRAVAEMTKATEGAIALNSRGQLRVPNQMWEKLTAEQQEAVSILATRAQECATSGEPNPGG
jgi:hypothetical protein